MGDDPHFRHCDGNEGHRTPGAGLDPCNKYSLYLSLLASEGAGDTDLLEHWLKVTTVPGPKVTAVATILPHLKVPMCEPSVW